MLLGAMVVLAGCGPAHDTARENANLPVGSGTQALGGCELESYMASHSALSDRTDFGELAGLVAGCSDQDTLVEFLGYPVDWNYSSQASLDAIATLHEFADDALADANASSTGPTVTDHFTPSGSCTATVWSGAPQGMPSGCQIVAVSGALGSWSYEASAYEAFADDPEEGASPIALSTPTDFGVLFSSAELRGLQASFLDSQWLAGARLFAAAGGSNSAVAHLDLSALQESLAGVASVIVGMKVNNFATVTLGDDEVLAHQDRIVDDSADDLVTPPGAAQITILTCSPSVFAGQSTLAIEASLIAGGRFNGGMPAMGAFVAVCAAH